MSSAKVDEDVVVVLPATPPESPQVNRYSKQTVDRDSLLIPTISHHERPHNHSHDDQQSKPQAQILTALAVGAPLVASVISSCASVISADMTASLGSDPHQRPVQASVVIALIWSALVTSLGSTLTAVAGLALHAGYHDQHVGITKRIVRFLRSRWKKDVKDRDAEHNEYTKAESRTPSPYLQPSMLSAITDSHKRIHEFCSFRAAVVSARLLGVSVALLAVALAVYLFLLYPFPVALSALLTGVITTAIAALPLLPILTHKDS